MLISMYGRTLDVYRRKVGANMRTAGVAKVNNKSNIYYPGGGFSGYTANIQYWDNATNPQQVYDIYKFDSGAV